MNRAEHQYIDRATGNVLREHLLADSRDRRAVFAGAGEGATG